MRSTLGSRQVLKGWVQNFVIFFWNVSDPWKHHSGYTWLSFQQMVFMPFQHNPESQYLPGDFSVLQNTNRENGSYLENLRSQKLFNWTFPQALSCTSQPIATGARDGKVPPLLPPTTVVVLEAWLAAGVSETTCKGTQENIVYKFNCTTFDNPECGLYCPRFSRL